MRRRIFLFSALLAGIAVILTSVLATKAAYDDFFISLEREVQSEALYIHEGYKIGGDGYVYALKHRQGHRLTLIAPDGDVLYDSVENAEEMDNHAGRPEVADALETGFGESTRYSDTVREQTYYYALQLDNGTILRMSSTTASFLASYERLFWVVALIAFAVIVVSGFIASFITRRIVNPINSLDLEHPENNVIYEELVPLLKRIREQRGQIDRNMRELDHGRREFSAITENMSEGFLVLDKSGKVLSYNESAARLLAAQTDDLSGVNVLALNREEKFRDAVSISLGGAAQETVLALHGRQCQIFANPVKESGIVQGLILLLLDVTEKQEREKLRREFTANVSHELKTPLTAISGYAEIMANGLVKPKDMPEFSQNIYREAQRMIVLVNDLMFLSGLEENTELVRETVDLLATANEVLRRLSPKAKENDITLNVSGEPAEINGIATVLEEMVYNLFENGIKYNKQGGSVSVVVRKTEDAAVLTVADTGIGIPAAEQDRIFERFYRVDKSHSNLIPGTGLGLSIVKHGALLHEAKIELESSENGSVFSLIFPCTDNTVPMLQAK